jgi:hypothetical protein
MFRYFGGQALRISHLHIFNRLIDLGDRLNFAPALLLSLGVEIQ